LSTGLLESNGLLLTRFYGGEARGVCYQITVEPDAGITGHYGDRTYIQLTARQVEELITALVKDRLGCPQTTEI
jgi:hypothetical protein